MSSSHMWIVLVYRIGEADSIGQEPARPAIERKTDLVAEHLLHGRDAFCRMGYAAFADLALIHARRDSRPSSARCHSGSREPSPFMFEWNVDPLLHHEEAFGLLQHPFDVGRVVLRPVPRPACGACVPL